MASAGLYMAKEDGPLPPQILPMKSPLVPIQPGQWGEFDMPVLTHLPAAWLRLGREFPTVAKDGHMPGKKKYFPTRERSSVKFQEQLPCSLTVPLFCNCVSDQVHSKCKPGWIQGE